jgi:hypothetical protein
MKLEGTLVLAKQIIDSHGWTVIKVLDRPTFAYTVGLTETFNHPELIMFGLAPDNMQSLLNNAAAIVRSKGRIEPYSLLDTVIDGYSCYGLPVDAAAREGYLNVAFELYGSGNVSAIQIVWPDVDGLFPFQQGCDEATVRYQTIIGRVTPDSQ